MADFQHILITGGCGFVGANLVRFLKERTTWPLRVVDDLRKGKREHVGQELAETVVGDVADPEVLAVALEGIDAVIHLASETGVVPSMEDPTRDFEGNILPTFRLLEASRTRGIGRLVFASTGAAVGEVPPPIHEEVLPKPLSPYGAAKLAGEAYCHAYAASFGMETVSLRFSNVYGPYSLHKRGNAVPQFIKRCLSGEDIVIYGDGTQTRDFIYARDLSDCIHRATTTEGIAGEVFQVATGVETPILDLARLVQKVTGATNEIRFAPSRAGEVYKSRADISKAGKLLGFQPAVALDEGIARTAQWYRENWTPGE